jgi:RNA polymerase sigma factor (sigma-70 family)
MKDQAKCFILSPGGYEEITYAELTLRRETDPSYADRRFIPVQGTLMEVGEDEYRDFYRDVERWKYIRRLEWDAGVVHYDALDTDEMNGGDIFPDAAPPIDEMVSDKLLRQDLRRCLALLSADDRALLTALYFEDKGENAVARELGITQQAVNKRRQKAIRKLKERMGF